MNLGIVSGHLGVGTDPFLVCNMGANFQYTIARIVLRRTDRIGIQLAISSHIPRDDEQKNTYVLESDPILILENEYSLKEVPIRIL
jgi:hypothetical protein